MNQLFRKKIFLLFWLLAIPLLSFSQGDFETFVDQEIDIVFDSYGTLFNDRFIPTVFGDNNGRHGVATNFRATSDTEWVVTYVPNDGFIGLDSFQVLLFPYVQNPTEARPVWFKVNVKASEVTAIYDLGTTNVNEPTSVEVLANDISSHGGLFIQNIALVNHGEAYFDEGSSLIEFIPEADFTGIAHLTYNVCDTVGTCDQGTVSININDPEASANTDTIKVFTKKNEPQWIILPFGLEISELPNNGTYDPAANQYFPDEDFVGDDGFTLTGNGNSYVVEVEVLDFESQVFTTNDKVYTSPYAPVEFNVLENDNNTTCFQVESQPGHGTIEVSNFPLGTITYFPDESFVGIDEFTYSVKAPGCGGEPEVATVQVVVSNFEPASSKYFLVTPKRTPLIIGYNVPIPDITFEIKDQGEYGQAMFLSGQVDTVIYGQPIQGENIIVYVPNDDVISAQDAFEIEYCTSYSGICRYSMAVKVEVQILDIGDPNRTEPFCIDDCVWPGDTNLDGVVNVEDLLPLGLSMGELGVPRSEADLNQWYGQFAPDWQAQLQSGQINLKHLDTDGDSMVTALDTMAISKFYGRTHDLTPTRIPNPKHVIRLKGTITANPGDVIELDMFMGGADNPAIDVYGFTFPFEYNPEFFVPESVNIQFERNSWLSYNSPVLKLSHNNYLGLVESAFTRTNGVSASGYGKIGTTRIVIEGNVEGFRPDQEEIEVPIGGNFVATATNSKGEEVGVLIEGTTIKIKLKKDTDTENLPISPDLLKVYPNPANNLLNVHLNGMNEFNRAVVYNMTGQKLLDTGSMQSNRAQLDVQGLDNGMYIISVYTGSETINKKFQVVR